MKISIPKHLQFSSSQHIKEAYPRQATPSPTNDGQKTRPLRGLDFLLSPFLVSRQEKEEETQEKRSQLHYIQRFREARPHQNAPSPPTGEQRKCPLRGLDFLLSPFLVSRQEKEEETQEKRSQLHYIQRFREAHPRQSTPSPTDGGQKTRPLFVCQGRGVLHTPP